MTVWNVVSATSSAFGVSREASMIRKTTEVMTMDYGNTTPQPRKIGKQLLYDIKLWL